MNRIRQTAQTASEAPFCDYKLHRFRSECSAIRSLLFFAIGILLVSNRGLIPPQDLHIPYLVLEIQGMLLLIAAGIMALPSLIERLGPSNEYKIPIHARYGRGRIWGYDGFLREIHSGTGWVFFLAAFLTPFYWWAMTPPDGLLLLILSIFSITLICWGAWLAWSICRRLKCGIWRVDFSQFPCRESEVVVQLLSFREISHMACRTYQLRCVVERFQPERDRKDRREPFERQVIYRAEPVEVSHCNAKEFRVQFLLDRNSLRGTRIGRDLRRYWELVVNCGTHNHGFLVPIYT